MSLNTVDVGDLAHLPTFHPDHGRRHSVALRVTLFFVVGPDLLPCIRSGLDCVDRK